MKHLILRDRKNFGSLLWRGLKWHAHYALTGRPRPLACGLYITSRCNLQCRFCNIWRKPSGSVLPLAQARSLIDDLSAMGCFYLSVSGGEPLLVEHLFDVLGHARRSRIRYLHLVTNGQLLDTGRVAQLKAVKLNEISISIDGSESFHDEVRGKAGTYARAVAAVESLKRSAPEIRVVLNAIFFPDHPEESLESVALARRLGVAVKFQPLNRHPVFDPDRPAVSPAEDFRCDRIGEVIASLLREKCVVNTRVFLRNMCHFFCCQEKLIFRGEDCLFGYHHVEILEDGRVFPCLEGLGWQAGQSLSGSLRDLIASDRYRQTVSGLKKCEGCRKNYYICYYEPRITFPFSHFLKYSFLQ